MRRAGCGCLLIALCFVGGYIALGLMLKGLFT